MTSSGYAVINEHGGTFPSRGYLFPHRLDADVVAAALRDGGRGPYAVHEVYTALTHGSDSQWRVAGLDAGVHHAALAVRLDDGPIIPVSLRALVQHVPLVSLSLLHHLVTQRIAALDHASPTA